MSFKGHGFIRIDDLCRSIKADYIKNVLLLLRNRFSLRIAKAFTMSRMLSRRVKSII